MLVTPTSTVVDSAGKLVLAATAITAQLSTAGTFSISGLVTTDNAGLSPPGWAYSVNIAVPGAAQVFYAYLPSGYGASVDVSQLIPAQAVPNVPNGMIAGVTVSGYPSAGQTIKATSATTAIWADP